MEREIIERLAIDSAAGELNDDMQVLFKTYLSEQPEANQWADDISKIYRMTEDAVRIKTEGAVRQVKEPVRINYLYRFDWLQIVRWAAIVVFAAFIGAMLGRSTKSPELQKAPGYITVSSTDTTEQPDRDISEIDDGFWKDKALAMLGTRSQSLQDNLGGGDGLWNKYREYIKEKNYE